MKFSKLKYAVLAATLMTGLISAPSQAGQLTTIKAIANITISNSTYFDKYVYIVTSSAITCGQNSTDRLRIALGQALIGSTPGIDPFFENYSTLLTAAQNNLTIEISSTNGISNGVCDVPTTYNGNIPPWLVYFQ